MIHEAWLVERLATAEARVVELEATLREIRQKTSCFETRRRVVVALDGAPPGPPAPPWVPGVNAPKAAPTASVSEPRPTCDACHETFDNEVKLALHCFGQCSVDRHDPPRPSDPSPEECKALLEEGARLQDALRPRVDAMQRTNEPSPDECKALLDEGARLQDSLLPRVAAMSRTDNPLVCVFCNRPPKDVKWMVADSDESNGSAICSECVEVCRQSIAERESRPETALSDELAPLRERMAKGRKKYPNGCTVTSLSDEAGEVVHAVNKYEPEERVREEILDVASVAMRLYLGEIDRGLTIDGLVQRRTDSGTPTGSKDPR